MRQSCTTVFPESNSSNNVCLSQATLKIFAITWKIPIIVHRSYVHVQKTGESISDFDTQSIRPRYSSFLHTVYAPISVTMTDNCVHWSVNTHMHACTRAQWKYCILCHTHTHTHTHTIINICAVVLYTALRQITSFA
jgi:hypothetical protein